jgi:hypothetical protein
LFRTDQKGGGGVIRSLITENDQIEFGLSTGPFSPFPC